MDANLKIKKQHFFWAEDRFCDIYEKYGVMISHIFKYQPLLYWAVTSGKR